MKLDLQSPVATLSGVGASRACALTDRGIATLAELLLPQPRRYPDLRARVSLAALEPGATVSVEGRLDGITERPMRGSRWRRIATGWLADAAGKRVRVVWFNLPAYMRGRLPSGQHVILHGRVGNSTDGTAEIIHPEVYPAEAGAPPAIRPVYGLPAQFTQRTYAAVVAAALAGANLDLLEAIPVSMRALADAMPAAAALRMLHQPPADADAANLNRATSPAHRALALDEMFAFQLAMGIERMRAAARAGAAMDGPTAFSSRFMRSLPFTPTDAQLRAIDEISADIARSRPMNRLLMGDVGSGKTLVAFHAAIRAIECGWQAAVMAPTELLAEQHHASFMRMCGGALGINSALMVGKASEAERARTRRLLVSGAIPIVFGTQALIQEGVAMKRLGLAIIDEQHRFGVFDRARLKALGPTAHVLLMTATPIPRSLALTLFANLDVSTLDEMPPGRTPIRTDLFAESDMQQVDALVRAELAAGHRAYYIAPLSEEDADQDGQSSVAAMAKRLAAGPLAGFQIGTLHGRMPPAEKERAMRKFRDGALQALVATTVVEVGIDVPEATAIVIASAERYGLAQLHQLRGRVGRGAAPSRCCLVVSRDSDPRACERLEVLVRCAGGAEIADADLRMRGPGDLLGARQSGALPLRFADFIHDTALIENARAIADRWLEQDPKLVRPESAGARAALSRMLDFGFSLGDVG